MVSKLTENLSDRMVQLILNIHHKPKDLCYDYSWFVKTYFALERRGLVENKHHKCPPVSLTSKGQVVVKKLLFEENK